MKWEKDRGGFWSATGWLRRIRPLDVVAVVFALAVCGASIGFAVERSSGPPVVDIQGANGRWMYPLSSEKIIGVSGPIGVTHVVVDRGAVYVRDSPCKEKICVNTGRISTVGSWIACLPNRVFVRIEGAPEKGVDIVAY